MKRINVFCALLLAIMLIPDHIEAQESLLCNGPTIEFESGLPAFFTTSASGNVYWTTTADSIGCGRTNQTPGAGEAACADSDKTNEIGTQYEAEMWTNSFDLSAYVGATLNFDAAFRAGVGSNKYFDVEITIDEGSFPFWINLLSWSESYYDPGEIVALDLAPYVGFENVRVRFRYLSNNPTNSFDWWVQVDAMSLDCSEPRPSAISVKDSFIKLDTVDSSPPSPLECDISSHEGRMIVDSVNSKLYICTQAGWKATVLN